MDDFSGDNWKQYFVMGSCRIQSFGPGRATQEGFTLIRKRDGLPVVEGITHWVDAVNTAKKLTRKLERELEKILLE